MNIYNDIANLLLEIPRLKNRVYKPVDLSVLLNESIPTPFAAVTAVSTNVADGGVSKIKLRSVIRISIFEKLHNKVINIQNSKKCREDNKQQWVSYLKTEDSKTLHNSPGIMWEASDSLDYYFSDIVFLLYEKLNCAIINNISTYTGITDIGLQILIELDVSYMMSNPKEPEHDTITNFVLDSHII